MLAAFRELNSPTFAVAWSPQGDFLASGHEDGALRLWDANSYQLIETVQANSEALVSITWSPDCSQLSTVSQDGTIRIWEIPVNE